MPIPPPVRGARAAFIFLTRIQLGGFPYSADDWKWAPAYFPFVGLVVGALGAGAFSLGAHLGSFPAAVLAVMTTVWITGAFHEDGLADTADAMGGAHSRKKLHEILKDSRIGTYGGSALVLGTLLRVSCLAELSDLGLTDWSQVLSVPWILMALHCLARVGPVVLMATLPYVAGEGAKGASVAAGGNAVQAVVACLWGAGVIGLGAFFGVAPTILGAIILAVVLTTACMGRWFYRRAGGVTGDFLGATEQAVEMVLLMVVLFLVQRGNTGQL